MNRDALLYIALSAFLLIIGQLTGRYILKKVYASAGVTQSNVLLTAPPLQALPPRRAD